MKNEKKHRIFIAIPLSRDFIESLEDHLKPFKMTGLKFISVDSWHLTLAFLGYLDEVELKELENILELFSKKTAPFVLKPKAIVFAPPEGISRMLWLKFDSSENYENMVLALEKEIFKSQKEKNFFSKFKPIRRPPEIHLTLARFSPLKAAIIKKRFQDLNLEKFKTFEKETPVGNIELMESKLRPEGARYRILSAYKLKNED
jgi:2'-5' RNA ligase